MPVILARMVMPRSRSRSLESMTRSTCSSWDPKMPLWLSMASTRVVFPWSTWAMMAILRIVVFLLFMDHVYRVQARGDSRGVQASQHGNGPNQEERSGQQSGGWVKLDRPAETLLIDYEY